MSALDYPEMGSRWLHRRTERTCLVLGHRTVNGQHGALRLVEFRYLGGGKGKRRRGPMQEMELSNWRDIFIKRVG